MLKVFGEDAVTAATDTTVNWLSDWIDQDMSSDRYDVVTNKPPPKTVIEDLKPYRLQKPTVLYRGLYWPDLESFLEASNRLLDHVPTIGEKFTYKDTAGCSSWTKSLVIAKRFAHDAEFGVVVKATMQPSETLADIDLLGDLNKAKRKEHEAEVIVLPGTRTAEVVYVQNEYGNEKIQAEKIISKNDSRKISASAIQYKLKEFNKSTADELLGLALNKSSTHNTWLQNPDALYSPSFVVIAYDGDKSIGWAGIGLTRYKPQVNTISVFILPQYRSKGIGEELVKSCLKEFKEYYDDDLDSNIITYDSWGKLKKLIEQFGFKAKEIMV